MAPRDIGGEVAGARGEAREEIGSDVANPVPDITKAADQAAFSHPGGGDPPNTGSKDGKLRSAAMAGLAATGLAAAGMGESGDAHDNGDALERIMRSPSEAVFEHAARLAVGQKKRFEDVGFDPSAETLMKDWNGRLKRALKGTKAAFTEHWKAAGALSEREFNAAVGRAIRNDDEADDPQAARAAKLWRAQVFEPITQAAIQAGLLPDDVEPQAAQSYFARTWSRSKLFAMERQFKETVAEYLSGRMEAWQRGVAGFDATTREIADDLFDTLTGRAEVGPRPEFARVVIAGQERSLHIPDTLAAPFLEDDIERIGRSFIRTMGADLELAQKFGTPDMAQALQGVEGRDFANLAALRDRVRGTRIEGTIERNYARIVRGAEHLDAFRATGEVSLPSLPDAIRPAMVEGLSAYMQTVEHLAADLKAVTLPPDDAALAGRVAERVLAHRLSQLAGIDDPYASRTPSDTFIGKMTDEASHSNGIRIFADMQKSFAAVMEQDRILRGQAEFDPDVAARIAEQFVRHGEEIDGIRVANTFAWDKVDATRRALRAYRAAAGSSLPAGTPTAEVTAAFKDFVLASYQRLLLRGLDDKATRFMGGLVAMTAMGMFAAWLQSGRAPGIEANPEQWIGEGFERAGIMAVPLELSDAFEKATGFNPLGPLEGGDAVQRLLPYNAYPGIRQMLGYALHPQD
jgi:hypothetical protein